MNELVNLLDWRKIGDPSLAQKPIDVWLPQSQLAMVDQWACTIGEKDNIVDYDLTFDSPEPPPYHTVAESREAPPTYASLYPEPEPTTQQRPNIPPV